MQMKTWRSQWTTLTLLKQSAPNNMKKSFYIHVKVTAGVRKESFKQKNQDHFEISVREKAERNMANKSALSAMAAHLKLPPRSVRLVSGHRQPSKIISVED